MWLTCVRLLRLDTASPTIMRQTPCFSRANLKLTEPAPPQPMPVISGTYLTGATQDFPNVISHHDLQYDPVNNTFLTVCRATKKTLGTTRIFLTAILQVDANGNVLWSWDIDAHIPLSEASIFNETTVYNGQTLIDFSHANSLDWDYNNSIIYLNLRCTNTFYKIDQATGDLFGHAANSATSLYSAITVSQVPSLWYHSHDTKQVAPDVFTMFDNDYDNVTNPNDCHSRMIELTLNETSMTAYVNWSWEAPTQYWNSYAGGTVLLPNGDYIGDFGDPTHQMPQNSPWNFNDTGAVFVEVNPAGQVVKTFTFPVGCYVYRIATIANPTAGIFPIATSSPATEAAPAPSYVTSTSNPTPTPTCSPAPSVTPCSHKLNSSQQLPDNN